MSKDDEKDKDKAVWQLKEKRAFLERAKDAPPESAEARVAAAIRAEYEGYKW